MLEEHPTWHIFDSTKLQDYMTCPRMYFYRYILGWRPEEPSIDLVFGSAWHLAMAILLEEGYTNKALALAYKELLAEFRKTFPEGYDAELGVKVPANAFRGLLQYVATYADDKFRVLGTEIAGTVPITEDMDIHYKIDAVIEDDTDKKIYVLEHKTGSTPSKFWQDQWALKIQIGTYAHVLYSMYQPEEIGGVMINGFFPHNAPRIKLDGTPYATDKDNEFLRMRVWMPPDRMQVWLETVGWYAEGLLQDMDALLSNQERAIAEPVMTSFHLNGESCSKYRGCPYRDFCVIWPNPMQRCKQVPLGFIQEYWDPRDSEKTAKEIRIIKKPGIVP